MARYGRHCLAVGNAEQVQRGYAALRLIVPWLGAFRNAPQASSDGVDICSSCAVRSNSDEVAVTASMT